MIAKLFGYCIIPRETGFFLQFVVTYAISLAFFAFSCAWAWAWGVGSGEGMIGSYLILLFDLDGDLGREFWWGFLILGEVQHVLRTDVQFVSWFVLG